MLSLGASAEVIAVAVEAVTLASRDASHIVTPTSRSPAAVRAARYRANLKQNQAMAGANDAAKADPQSPKPERDASRDGVTMPCNLSSLTSSVLLTEKEDKKERVARARGTRISADWWLSDADWKFARDLGMSEGSINAERLQFIDYWIGVPGQRGTKLDWSATWRNRVRAVTSKGKGNDDKKSVLAAGQRQLDGFGGMAAARAYVPGSSGPAPLSLDFGVEPPSPKLISSR